MHARYMIEDCCYEYLGRRCKLIGLEVSPEGEATAKIATGRSFDNTIVLKGESWAPLFFGEIGMLWDMYKQNEQEYRELRRTAKDMNELLGRMIGASGVQGKVEFNQAGGHGEIVIRGDLDQLQPLVDKLGSLSITKVDALQQLFVDLIP